MAQGGNGCHQQSSWSVTVLSLEYLMLLLIDALCGTIESKEVVA